MALYTAVEIMWMRPKASVLWVWNCIASPGVEEPNSPPPLFFWLIPLSPPSSRSSPISAAQVGIHQRQRAGISEWSFELLIRNYSDEEIALKINI